MITKIRTKKTSSLKRICYLRFSNSTEIVKNEKEKEKERLKIN